MTDLDKLAKLVRDTYPESSRWRSKMETIAPELIAVAQDAAGLAYVCEAVLAEDYPCGKCWQCRARAHQAALGEKLAEVFRETIREVLDD